MDIHAIYHVNLNCRDFDASLAFYTALGFEVDIPFPIAGHEAVGAVLGVGAHKVRGALLRLGNDPQSARLDLLEWIEPRNDSPSPLRLTDPGFVRIALASANFDADVRRLRERGVQFIAEPMVRHTESGTVPMLVCFRDPDGNVVELVNRPRPKSA